MTRLSNTAAWLLAATLFFVAVAWTNLTALGLGANQLTYDDVALPRFAVALVGAALVWFVLAIMIVRGNALLVDATWGVLGVLAVWAVVSSIVSGNPMAWLGQSERLEGAVTVALYAAFFGAGLQLGRSKRYVRRMCAALAFGAVLLAILGLMQVAGWDPTNYRVSGASFYMGSAFASLGNPNFLAGVLVLVAPVVVGLALTTSHRLARVGWWIAAVLVSAALYTTYSQGAWLAAVVEVAVGAGIWVWSRHASTYRPTAEKSRRPLARAVAVVAIVITVGVVVIVGVTTVATQRGLRLWGSGLSETGSARVLLAQTTVSAVAHRPLFGFGPDNYLAAFRLHRPAGYVDTFGPESTNNNAHSWPLQYATTMGVLGMLLLGAALVIGIARSRPRDALRADDAPGILATMIWLGVIGFAVQMMFNVAMLASTIPMWALLGAISSARASHVRVDRPVAIASVAAAAVLVVGAVAASGLLLTADATYMTARLAYNGVAPGDPVALTEKAGRLNPLSVKYSRALAQSRSDVALREMQRADATDGEVGDAYVAAKGSFDETLRRWPNDYAALSWLAGLQTAAGTRLGDATLLSAAQESAKRAASVDVAHSSVQPLLAGDTSTAAVKRALAAAGLP